MPPKNRAHPTTGMPSANALHLQGRCGWGIHSSLPNCARWMPARSAAFSGIFLASSYFCGAKRHHLRSAPAPATPAIGRLSSTQKGDCSMSDIQHPIELLKNNNPNTRYNACEELRVARQSLPQEAIDALRFATNDSNPEVADAAQRDPALQTQLTL